MIRLTVLLAAVGGLSLYAWRDWFVSLCGLVLLMAIIEHEDMPKNVMGIQGLNTWNFLFVFILIAWAITRCRRGLQWDLPRNIVILLLLYIGVILAGVGRAILDHQNLPGYPMTSLISEELINTVKWVIPGLLLFDGCRNRKQVLMVLACLLAMYFLISLQVMKRMPFESALSGGSESMQRVRLKVCRSIGYSAVDMSVILSGASWGILAILPLLRRRIHQVIVVTGACMVAFGQALTGGRAGYMAWGATGLVLCLLKWRKLLLLAPVALVLFPILLPGTVDRMFFGFGQTDVTGQATVDDYSVTSGRTLIWPMVVAKIGESPLIGYGRLAMGRTGLATRLWYELGESFPHPHNLYLETLLDNGIIGSVPIILFWATIVVYSARLFRSDNRLYSAVGGVSLSLVLAQLFAGIGSQHFYPRESTMCVWVAMFLALRVHVEEMRVRAGLGVPEELLEAELPQRRPDLAAAYDCDVVGS